MAKIVDDTVLDAALNIIKNGATQLCVCNALPTTYTQATATYKLALKGSLTSANFTGPAEGDSSGRKLTVNQQATITVDTSGDATHIALCSGSVLLFATTCTLQTLTAANTVTVPAFDIELSDPA
jgi:hypothetical protein